MHTLATTTLATAALCTAPSAHSAARTTTHQHGLARGAGRVWDGAEQERGEGAGAQRSRAPQCLDGQDPAGRVVVVVEGGVSVVHVAHSQGGGLL